MASYIEPEPLATTPEAAEVETGRSNPGHGSMTSPELSKKIRVQFEFVPEALARLDALKEVTGAPTRAETVRRALHFYEWLVNQARQGNTIATFDKKHELVTQFPADFLMR